MMSVHDRDHGPGPRKPQNLQKPSIRAKREVKWILVFLWIVVGIFFMWFAITYSVIYKQFVHSSDNDYLSCHDRDVTCSSF